MFKSKRKANNRHVFIAPNKQKVIFEVIKSTFVKTSELEISTILSRTLALK